MPASSDSDQDLPTPDQLFDRLLLGRDSSINKHDPLASRSDSHPPATASTSEPVRDAPCRRSSPRLRERHDRFDGAANPSLGLPLPLPLPLARSPFGTSTVDQRHVDLANELFPPSPPRNASFVREETVISDSEPERDHTLRYPRSNQEKPKTPSRRRARVSATFSLDDYDDDEEQDGKTDPLRGETRPAAEGQRDGQDDLTQSLSALSIGGCHLAHSQGASPAQNHAFSILVAYETFSSTSSDSSSASSDDEARTERRHIPPREGLQSQSGSEIETEEVLMVETDDEGNDDTEHPDAGTVLPVLEPTFWMPQNTGESESSGGRAYGYKGMDDVWEDDGVLIYDPTPRKRPTKFSIFPATKPSPAPFSRLSTVTTPVTNSITSFETRENVTRDQTVSPTKRVALPDRAKSKPPLHARDRPLTNRGRVEIDLTGSSSDEAEPPIGTRGASTGKYDRRLPPPPPRSLFSTPFSKGQSTTNTKHRRQSPSKDVCRSPSSSPVPPPVPRTPKPKPKPKPAAATSSAASSSHVLTPSERTQLPLALIRQLDKQVFRKAWSQDGLRCLDGEGEYSGAGLPPGLEVVWNARLRNTAGRAKWKKVKVSGDTGGGLSIRHDCTIELATKVTDTEAKLRNTLAHELCHIAAWVLSNEVKPPHGGAFKLWAARIMQVVPDIKVTTTHSYQIVYKYRWRCTSSLCGKIFGRHSNSINPSTHGCPCGSKLVEIDKDGNVKAVKTVLVENARGEMVETPVKRKKSDWLEFVAAQSPIVRKERPEIAQSDVLKVVAERWKLVKAQLAVGSSATRHSRAQEEQQSGLEDAMTALQV
ncbi:hypothetical protein JCM11491_005553 [Sporobolomyces phaffii]